MNNYPSLSFAITVCNEINEIQQLISQIKIMIKKDDEIIILFDTENGSEEVKEYLNRINVEMEFEGIQFHRVYHKLNNDFASHKNFLLKHASKDVVVLMDSDELFGFNLEQNIHQLIDLNKDIDVIMIPRENYIEGGSIEEIQKLYGWRFNEYMQWNYPDYQQRILINHKNIYFEGKVHERLVGYETITTLPQDIVGWGIIHTKTFERQKKQNEFYSKI